MKLEAALFSIAAIVRTTRGYVLNVPSTDRSKLQLAEPLGYGSYKRRGPLLLSLGDDGTGDLVGIRAHKTQERNGKHQDSNFVKRLQQINGESDFSKSGKLLKEDFDAYKEKQKKREKFWECKVEELNKTIEDLELRSEGDGDASPGESQEWKHSNALEYKRKLTALKQEHATEIQRIKKEYVAQLQSQREKHEIEAKVAEEQLMQINIHHQKLLQGIKDRAAQKEEQLIEESAAKLHRKKEENTALRVALSKANDRVTELEDIVMSMYSERQSLRGLAQCAFQTIKARGIKRWQGFVEKLRNRR